MNSQGLCCELAGLKLKEITEQTSVLSGVDCIANVSNSGKSWAISGKIRENLGRI